MLVSLQDTNLIINFNYNIILLLINIFYNKNYINLRVDSVINDNTMKVNFFNYLYEIKVNKYTNYV